MNYLNNFIFAFDMKNSHILDFIFNDVSINFDLNLKENTSFEVISKEYEFAFPEHYDKLDLEYDQRDDCIKQYDFLMRSNKEINGKTDVSTAYLELKKSTEEFSSQLLNKWMMLDCQNEAKNKIQILPELPIPEPYNCNQSLWGRRNFSKLEINHSELIIFCITYLLMKIKFWFSDLWYNYLVNWIFNYQR